MDFSLLIDNLTNPALLFFFLGIFAVQVKSDLAIPPSSSKFISLYLLFAIGFKGGQELAHNALGLEVAWSLLFGVCLAVVIPLYSYFILRRKMSVDNAAAIAAAFGSVSAVTFVTTANFLEVQQIPYSGHMVAVMALMEAPAIIVGVMLFSLFSKNDDKKRVSMPGIIKHALTNGSVFLIIGSLVIGFLASEKQAEGIKPFTNDIFKGFLAIFLLDMGITTGKNLKVLFRKGWFPFAFSIVVPLVNGVIVAMISGFVTPEIGNRLMFAILAASASYIAVPAAMRLAIPKASPSLYIPMALAITFPFNITIGMPLYLLVIQYF
ncbi:MAG: sodium-dependent bicarbonate transport family permease [Bacteroidia bacterium]